MDLKSYSGLNQFTYVLANDSFLLDKNLPNLVFTFFVILLFTFFILTSVIESKFKTLTISF